jgi:hypothetical protein
VITQDDGWDNLSLVVMTYFGCRGLFHPCRDLRNVTYVDHERSMVQDHTQIKREKRVTC